MTHGPHWPLKHVTSEHRSFIADLNVHPLATPWSTAAVTIKICTRSSRLELFRSHGQSALVVVPIEDNSIAAYKYIHIVYLHEFAFLPLLHTKTMAGKLSVLFLVGFVAAVVVAPYMMAEARYLPTRGNDDRLTRLKEMLTDLLDSGAQPNLEMERQYVDVNGDFSRLRPREYNIPEKSIMELFNPTVPHHQRPRS